MRTELTLVLAVNGLKDHNLCKVLIERNNLTWDKSHSILRARSNAIDAVEKLGNDS